MAGQEKPSSSAIASLVLGIMAFVCSCGIFTAVPAWIIGKNELARIDAGQSPAAGRTLAQVGMIMGIIGTVLGIIGLIWMVFFGGLAVLQASLHQGR
jgi:hypothetical protein